MEMEQLSGFMSGCAVEFLGVYLITSKRSKRINNPTPALSNSADSGTAISFSDEEEALDRLNLLPSDHLHHQQQQQQARKRISLTTNNNNSFEAWQEANSHLVSSMNHHHGHRRHSSVFRGISMASQLLDRNDEQQGAIQLPTHSPRRNNENTLGNIISGITSAITSHTTTPYDNNALEDPDAVEIEIPTPSSFHLEESDRELMPLQNNNNNNRRTSKLIHIQEDERDLS